MVKCSQYLMHVPLAIKMSTWSICSQRQIKQRCLSPTTSCSWPPFSICPHVYRWGQLPVGLSCKHAMAWWSSAHLAVIVLSPCIQAKYGEICSDSMWSIFAVTDNTAQFKTYRDSRCILQNILSGITKCNLGIITLSIGEMRNSGIVAHWVQREYSV